MIEYLLLLLTFIIFTHFYLSPNNNFLVFIILSFLLIVFSALRWDIGVDYLNYYELVSDYSSDYSSPLDFWVKFETAHGFIINSLFYFIQDRNVVFNIYILVMSFFTVCCFSFFIFKFSNDKFLSLFIFMSLPIFYLSSFNAIRMFSAVSLFLVSLHYIQKRQLFRYFIMCILCLLLHKVSFVLFPLYFFLNLKFTSLQYLLLLTCTVLFPFYEKLLITFSKYSGLSHVYFIENQSSLNVTAIIFFVLAFVIVFTFKIKSVSCPNTNMFINLLIISQIIIIISLNLPLKSDNIFRITGFFTPAIIILLPEFFNLIKFKQLYLARKLLIYLCLSYFLFTLTQNGIIYNLVPYKTILPFYFL